MTKQTPKVKTVAEPKTFVMATKAHKYDIPIKYQGCTSVSSVIRAMAADGLKTAEIHKATKIRYQHVRNVLLTPVKKAG